MPRYDDRHGTTRLYVGHLSSRTRSRDLEDVFSRYGRVRDVDMKRDFAFVEFSDSRDADDARYNLNGRDVDGSRIVVEFAKGAPRGPGGSREFLGKGPAPGSGRCFNCGIDGHWARDCKAGDWKNKCYRCGDRGHIEKNCQNSPKKLKRARSYSRTPSPGHGRSRSRSYSRGRSYSRSRSPPKERSVERAERRSRSPRRRRSSPPPTKGRKHSLSPDEQSPRGSGNSKQGEGSDYHRRSKVPRGPSGSREFLGKLPAPGPEECLNWGLDGHLVRDYKAGSYSSKASPGHGRSRSRYSRDSSYRSSRPRSPSKERGVERAERRSRSPRPPTKGRKHSPSPDEQSPRGRAAPSHGNSKQGKGSDYHWRSKARSRSRKENGDRTTCLYVGPLSSQTSSQDLEKVFSEYGRIHDVRMNSGFAFVEFSDSRDADDARYSLNGQDVDGSHIVVEFANREPRGCQIPLSRKPASEKVISCARCVRLCHEIPVVARCKHVFCKGCLAYIISTSHACLIDGNLVTVSDSVEYVQ